MFRNVYFSARTTLDCCYWPWRWITGLPQLIMRSLCFSLLEANYLNLETSAGPHRSRRLFGSWHLSFCALDCSLTIFSQNRALFTLFFFSIEMRYFGGWCEKPLWPSVNMSLCSYKDFLLIRYFIIHKRKLVYRQGHQQSKTYTPKDYIKKFRLTFQHKQTDMWVKVETSRLNQCYKSGFVYIENILDASVYLNVFK